VIVNPFGDGARARRDNFLWLSDEQPTNGTTLCDDESWLALD
jgi:hypothetical protein